jgi:hypothetical protein
MFIEIFSTHEEAFYPHISVQHWCGEPDNHPDTPRHQSGRRQMMINRHLHVTWVAGRIFPQVLYKETRCEMRNAYLVTERAQLLRWSQGFLEQL